MLLDVLVPPRCLACGRAGADLCGACRRELPFLVGPCCERCALPLPCGRHCPAAGHAYDAAHAAVAHEGSARRLVAALKFREGRRAAATMAAQMAVAAPALPAGAVLVPAPAHPSRVRARGYDQAVVLARALGRRTGLPVSCCLARGGATTRQMGAGRDERLRAGRIVLHVVGQAPEVAVLVDDVHTTGATLDAGARALRLDGTRRVVAVTYARTL